MHYVIGSGPTGISCAYALVNRGVEVTLIDTGLEMEPSRRLRLTRLEGTEPKQWPNEGAFLKEGVEAGADGIPLKMAYGSDFPYQKVPGATEIVLNSARAVTSYAQGGFSNVWGGAVLPYCQDDIRGWPIDVHRLKKHYSAVFDFMPLAARHDSLEQQFPLYARSHMALRTSKQAKSMLRNMKRHDAALRRKGVSYGRSRIAVHAEQGAHHCVHCGLCIYGCPYGLIYSSAATLQQLMQRPNFHYIPGTRVTRVEESNGQARITTVSVGRDCAQTFSGERVYLACGTFETTVLLLRSLNQYDRITTAVDSPYFLLPILRYGGTKAVRREPLHTLAQLFLEIADPKISQYTVHFQLYTYNDLFESAIKSALGRLSTIFPIQAALSRLLVLQGFFHSTHSSGIDIELRRKGSGEEVLMVTSREPLEAKMRLRTLVRKLYGLHRELGALPLSKLLRIGDPGRSFHTGGSFPMREFPEGLETDIFGRPAGMRRIHAVDSSILPSIAATTITLTAMANAHRIGDELDLYS